MTILKTGQSYVEDGSSICFMVIVILCQIKSQAMNNFLLEVGLKKSVANIGHPGKVSLLARHRCIEVRGME